jgi:quinol monooxygenase YgiN
MTIHRIVKMKFAPDKLNTFKELFATVKDKIQDFEGCKNVEAFQDCTDPTIFFTYSTWDSLEKLDNYRNSDFFKSTWRQGVFQPTGRSLELRKNSFQLINHLLKS